LPIGYCVGHSRNGPEKRGVPDVKKRIPLKTEGSFFEPFCKVRGLTAPRAPKNRGIFLVHFCTSGCPKCSVGPPKGQKMVVFWDLRSENDHFGGSKNDPFFEKRGGVPQNWHPPGFGGFCWYRILRGGTCF